MGSGGEEGGEGFCWPDLTDQEELEGRGQEADAVGRSRTRTYPILPLLPESGGFYTTVVARSGGTKELEFGRSRDQETSTVLASDVDLLLSASCSSLQAVAALYKGRLGSWSRSLVSFWSRSVNIC